MPPLLHPSQGIAHPRQQKPHNSASSPASLERDRRPAEPRASPTTTLLIVKQSRRSRRGPPAQIELPDQPLVEPPSLPTAHKASRAQFRPSAPPKPKCQIGTFWTLKYLLGVGCREVWAVGLVLLGVGCRAQFCGKNHDMYARDPLPLKKPCVSLVFLLGGAYSNVQIGRAGH